MAAIYDYMDYRRYLKDYYAERKAKAPSFSYEAFARKAGLKSKGMLHDILNGKRNLTRDCLFKVAEACGLSGKALAFFELLVAYGQAGSMKERNWFLGKLKESTTPVMASMDGTAREDRDQSSLLIALDEKGFGALKEEIQSLREKILKLSEEQVAPDRIFQVDFLVLPATRPFGGAGP